MIDNPLNERVSTSVGVFIIIVVILFLVVPLFYNFFSELNKKGGLPGVISMLESEETANWKTYKNEKYQYEIKYPLGWKFIEKSEMKDITFYSTNYTLEVYIEEPLLPKGTGQLRTRELLKILDEKQNPIFVNQKQVELSGHSGIMREELGKHYGLSEIVAYCAKNNKLFVITLAPFDKETLNVYTDPSEIEEVIITNESRKLFYKILSTFRFLD